MYFQNEQHKKCYEHLTTKVFKNANSDGEYHAMAYILALPEIYVRCVNDAMLDEFPFLWTKEYVDTSYFDEDEDGEFKVIDFNVKKDKEGNSILSENFATLSSGYKKMVYLAQNLFNPSNETFNLADAFCTWDNHLVKAYQQAVLLRLNRNVNGMEITIK